VGDEGERTESEARVQVAIVQWDTRGDRVLVSVGHRGRSCVLVERNGRNEISQREHDFESGFLSQFWKSNACLLS